VPSTPETRVMIGADQRGAMKPSAVLINVARGDIVDQTAVLDAFQAGRIRGAVLDYFLREPLPPSLWRAPQALLTPHIAWHAAAADSREKRSLPREPAALSAGPAVPQSRRPAGGVLSGTSSCRARVDHRAISAPFVGPSCASTGGEQPVTPRMSFRFHGGWGTRRDTRCSRRRRPQ
jgi:D-isomer specific 2-hydroxyacid dehydrogenase, NAD binding domain